MNIALCPWCPVTGSKVYVDQHIIMWHEEPQNLDEKDKEIRRLKAVLTERQKDYSRTLKEMAALLHDAQMRLAEREKE